MLKIVALFFVVVNLALIGCSSGIATSRNNENSICSILESPEDFAGKSVSVYGYYRTDYRHYAGISDGLCPNKYIPLDSKMDILGYDEVSDMLYRIRQDNRKSLYVRIKGVIYIDNDGRNLRLAVSEFSDASIKEDETF